MAKKNKLSPGNIAVNRKARFDYFLSDKEEAGIMLQGWEVKSLRAGRINMTDCFVDFRKGEAWLLGVDIAPMPTASTHFVVEPKRPRKLLLSRRQLDNFEAAVAQKGYTCVCTTMYWKAHLVKCEISLAKGKANHDKRDTEKDRDWGREQQRIMRGR